MPEIKRLFSASRMNRDKDDRLVTPGEYREALNINVSKSEGSDMGAIENLLGNKEIVTTGIANAKVIGSLRDNGNEKIYLPAYTIKKANKIEDKIMINLIIFEILFAEVLANHVRRT